MALSGDRGTAQSTIPIQPRRTAVWQPLLPAAGMPGYVTYHRSHRAAATLRFIARHQAGCRLLERTPTPGIRGHGNDLPGGVPRSSRRVPNTTRLLRVRGAECVGPESGDRQKGTRRPVQMVSSISSSRATVRTPSLCARPRRAAECVLDLTADQISGAAADRVVGGDRTDVRLNTSHRGKTGADPELSRDTAGSLLRSADGRRSGERVEFAQHGTAAARQRARSHYLGIEDTRPAIRIAGTDSAPQPFQLPQIPCSLAERRVLRTANSISRSSFRDGWPVWGAPLYSAGRPIPTSSAIWQRRSVASGPGSHRALRPSAPPRAQ